MMKKMFTIALIISGLFVGSLASYKPCFKRHTRSIPTGHLMATKTKPLVLGHRGNPLKYQENTLDGFKSLLETNADGFELDIYLTKDKKLVVFHDDNTKKLTGIDKVMWNSTADELTKINVKKTLKFGGKEFNYDKPRPIPLLEDVLKAMKNSGKLMYLEIKPSTLRDLTESMEVGSAVAKMVTDMNLVKQASIISFDPMKTLAAHKENPDIPTGFFYHSKWWRASDYPALNKTISQVPGMKNCLKLAPSGTAFIKTMFKYGDVMKAVNASFLDMHYVIYDNPTYSNNTFQTLRKNYNPSISAGAWTLYGMSNSKEDDSKQDAVIDNLVKQGAQRLITDDIDRMLKKLGRPNKDPKQPKASSTKHKPVLYLVFIAAMFLLVL